MHFLVPQGHFRVTFDESGTSVAGYARWGDLPVAAPVDSDDG